MSLAENLRSFFGINQQVRAGSMSVPLHVSERIAVTTTPRHTVAEIRAQIAKNPPPGSSEGIPAPVEEVCGHPHFLILAKLNEARNGGELTLSDRDMQALIALLITALEREFPEKFVMQALRLLEDSNETE